MSWGSGGASGVTHAQVEMVCKPWDADVLRRLEAFKTDVCEALQHEVRKSFGDHALYLKATRVRFYYTLLVSSGVSQHHSLNHTTHIALLFLVGGLPRNRSGRLSTCSRDIFQSDRDSLHVVVSPLIFQHTKLHVYEDLTPECLVRPHDVTVLGVVKTWVERRIAV